jgi:hypothetical protein
MPRRGRTQYWKQGLYQCVGGADVHRERARYECGFRKLIADGVREGRFRVASVKLTSYAILDLGMGASVWYRENGGLTEDEVVYQYGDFALRLAGTC